MLKYSLAQLSNIDKQLPDLPCNSVMPCEHVHVSPAQCVFQFWVPHEFSTVFLVVANKLGPTRPPAMRTGVLGPMVYGVIFHSSVV